MQSVDYTGDHANKRAGLRRIKIDDYNMGTTTNPARLGPARMTKF